MPTIALYGLSTDEKPIQWFKGKCIPNGSTFQEIDTTQIYMYDTEKDEWFYQKNYNNDMGSLKISTIKTDDGFLTITYADGTTFCAGKYIQIL